MSGPAPLILVVEDEPQMRRFIRASLGAHGYEVEEATTAAETTALVASRNPAAILLDLGLPDGDGIDLTRRLREWCHAPIVVVSARGREEDKVAALDAGADDYLTKPFGLEELLARLRVALRHVDRASGAQESPVFTTGELEVDLAARQVRVRGREVHLTPTEFRLLAILTRHAGKVVTQRQLLIEVWGRGAAGNAHYLRVQMHGLRHKLEENPALPRYLVTEPGVGYRLREEA